MKPTFLHALALLGLLSAAGCSSPSTHLQRLARDQQVDMETKAHSGDEMRAAEARTAKRVERVRQWIEHGEVKSADDHFHAALVLVQSNQEADLDEANAQALKAAELGENRGFRVSAEAFDKLMVKRGLAQRYGTQFMWEPVLRGWRLYATDPRTTDAERAAMGVPSMAQLLEQEKALNATVQKPIAAH